MIPNGIDLPDRAIDPTGPDSPSETDVADGPVLFLGRIDVRQKGLDLLLAAVRADPTIRLDVAGSGTAAEEARLRELVGGLEDRVRLLGRVEGEAKEELLRGASVMVVPSRYETFCLTALEAMAHGRPVITFDLDRLGWIGAGAGITVPAFDVDALARRRSAGCPGPGAARGARSGSPGAQPRVRPADRRGALLGAGGGPARA